MNDTTCYPVHLCLVSNQPIPSLTPLIDKGLGVTNVILVAAPDRQDHAQWLNDALEIYGINVEIVMLHDGYHLPTLREEFAHLRERLPSPLAINLTGGTKLMTLAVWEVFNRPGDIHYYVNIHTDAIDWLRPAGRPSHPVADRLLVEPYLTAWGAFLNPKTLPQRTALPGPRRDLAYKLLESKRLRQASSQLKPLLQQQSTSQTFQLHGHEVERLRSLLEHLERGGIIIRRESDYQFTSVDGRRFIDGCWLEEAVFETLCDLAREDHLIHDVVRNLCFHRAGNLQDALVNEIDVACLRNNTLYLIECKTGLRQNDGTAMSIAEQTLHKLDASKDTIGGLRSRALLVSQRTAGPTLRKRAVEKGIDIIDGDAIATLPERLRAWLSGSLP